MWDNPEGGELDHAVDIRMHYKNNSPSVLSYLHIGKRTKEDLTVAAKSLKTVHSVPTVSLTLLH